MRRSCLFPFSAVLLALPPAAAQSISEAEFLSGVTAESSAVRALDEDLSRAEAVRRRAGLLENPRLDFWREQPEANPRVTNWTLSWTPPLDGRYALGRKSADAGVAAARERLRIDKAALRLEIRAAFADWSAAFERREVLRVHAERVHGLAQVERERARVGEGSWLAARRLSLAEAETRALLAAAEAALVRSEPLARAWRPDLGPGTVPSPLVPPDPPTSTEAAEPPELSARLRELEQAELERKRAGRFLGFPTLQFGWQQLEDRGVGRSGPIFAAAWSLPLFDRDQPARLEAEQRRLAAAARVEAARSRVAARVEGGAIAYRALASAAREAVRSREDAEKVTLAATAAFRAGESSLTDLLDGLRAASAARLGEIDLREQALAAHRELEAALGRPLVGGGF
jgi:cobalt-zinc-cadmium efflux system outer membrane protein